MRRLFLLLVAATLSAGAQQAPQPPATVVPGTNLSQQPLKPTYADLYCAGFMRSQLIPRGAHIAGGLHSPNATQFATNDTVFITGASGLHVGDQLSLVRELRDPNRSETYMGQHAAVGAAGHAYADLGRVRVTAMRGRVAIANIDFSCAPAVPGDLAIPFQERASVTLRPYVPPDRFPQETPGPKGKIVLAKDFDVVLGTGHKVYLNLGSDKGVKPGDYVRILRSYDPSKMEPVDRLSYKPQSSEETQAPGMNVDEHDYAQLPERVVGEAVVLMSGPGSSTAMITYALEDVLVGDEVEMQPAGR